MPTIYLSPSTQEWNQYVTGSGSEEYNMNLLAGALGPYLLSNAIQYKRNRPEMTAGSSIREANAGSYDLYLALHSNGAPEGHYGEERGIIAFYYPGSSKGQRAAELIAAGRVNLDHAACLKPDKQVVQGAVLTARGLGKAKLIEVGGLTKKGRVGIVIERYL